MDKIKVILVDQSENPVGETEKMKVHRKGLLHRAVSVFIVNSAGEWLLHRRALDKYHSGGLWNNTTYTHHYPKTKQDFRNYGLMVFPKRFYTETL